MPIFMLSYNVAHCKANSVIFEPCPIIHYPLSIILRAAECFYRIDAIEVMFGIGAVDIDPEILTIPID